MKVKPGKYIKSVHNVRIIANQLLEELGCEIIIDNICILFFLYPRLNIHNHI